MLTVDGPIMTALGALGGGVAAAELKSRGFFVGEFCDDADQCSDGPPHTTCNAMSQRCECDPDYPIIVDGSICVQRESLFLFSFLFFSTLFLLCGHWPLLIPIPRWAPATIASESWATGAVLCVSGIRDSYSYTHNVPSSRVCVCVWGFKKETKEEKNEAESIVCVCVCVCLRDRSAEEGAEMR